MHYVIVDRGGNSRQYVDSFGDLMKALAAPSSRAEAFMVLRYETGQRTGEPIDVSQVPYMIAVGQRNTTQASAAIHQLHSSG